MALSSPFSSNAQTTLNKLSLAKRGDGKGYVIRFHLTASIDSAKIIQPNAELIQVAAYSSGFTLGINQEIDLKSPIKNVETFKIESGYGFDFHLEPNTYFITQIYPDANKKDWLLALTFASENDVSILTNGLSKIDWTTEIIRDTTYSEMIDDSSYVDSSFVAEVENDTLPEGIDFDFNVLVDDAYNKVKDKAKFDRIVLDAGHGGKDGGSVGYSKSKEKDIALAVVLKVGALIEKNIPDLKVIYTRKDNRFIELEDRGHFANKVEGDIFLSIHCNAAKNRNARGTEVFFLGQHRSDDAFEIMTKENSVIQFQSNDNKTTELTAEQLIVYELMNSGNMSDSQILAEMIDNQFKAKKRKTRGVKQAGFIVLYYAAMPSILVELGFISNKEEERFLKSERGQNIMAEAIFTAIKEYKNRMDVR